MLDPSIAAAKMYSNASRFIEAYHAVLQPLAREAELPAMALDILLFIANNQHIRHLRKLRLANFKAGFFLPFVGVATHAGRF